MFWQTLTAGLIACFVTTSGIFAVSRFHAWAKTYSVYFMSFAAGILITVSFMHLIPKSLFMNDTSPVFLLLGFFGLYSINKLIKIFFCSDNRDDSYINALIPVIGIAFHSLIDGVVYVVTFNVGFFTGVVSAVGMVLHEFPEGVVSYAIFNDTGLSRKRSFIYAFLVAALTTPLGVLIAYPFVGAIEKQHLGSALAVSAGALIYAGASHLLPSIEQKKRRFTFVALMAGITVAVLMIFLKSH